jgi:hypothetical protein
MDPAIARAQEVMDFVLQNEAMFHVLGREHPQPGFRLVKLFIL